MRPSACLLALEASPAPLALSCPPADLLSLSSAEIACVPYAALEAARCDTGDVDDADAVEPASRSRVPGAAVALALSPSEDQVAVVCAGSSLIALFALPDLRPLGQCDAGAPPAACAWTDDAHLLVRPAATACATLRGLGGEEVASSAMADVAAICVGWLSDAPDAAPTVFVANGDTVQQCGADLQPQRELPDVSAEGFHISQLSLLDANTLFVGYMPVEGQEEEPCCRFVDLTAGDAGDTVDEGWIGDGLFDEEDGQRIIPHRVSYFLAPFRGDGVLTSTLMVTSCAGTLALMQPDDGEWEAWDPEETTGNDVPMPNSTQYEYDRVIGAAVRIAEGGGAGTGLFYTGEGRLLMYPMQPDSASKLAPPVVRTGAGSTAAPSTPAKPSAAAPAVAPPPGAPPTLSFSAPAPAPAASTGSAPSFSFGAPAAAPAPAPAGGAEAPPTFSFSSSSTATSGAASGAAAAPAAAFSFAKPAATGAPAASTSSAFSFSKPAAAAEAKAPATDAAASKPAFGGFGAAPASGAAASKPAFGGFGAAPAAAPASDAAASKPAFGGFGAAPASDAAASKPAFGGFGAAPASGAAASKPAFGGFGAAPASDAAASKPAFGGFGAAAAGSAAPAAGSAAPAAPGFSFSAKPASSSAFAAPAPGASSSSSFSFATPAAATAKADSATTGTEKELSPAALAALKREKAAAVPEAEASPKVKFF